MGGAGKPAPMHPDLEEQVGFGSDKSHGGPQKWAVVVPDTIDGARADPVAKLPYGNPDGLLDALSEVQGVADSSAVAIEDEDCGLRDEAGLVDHDDT